MFNHFIGNNLLIPSQTGFLPGDSCIADPLAIIHEIQADFDSNPPVDVRVVFLDISEAFDKVWHKGVLLNLNPIFIILAIDNKELS